MYRLPISISLPITAIKIKVVSISMNVTQLLTRKSSLLSLPRSLSSRENVSAMGPLRKTVIEKSKNIKVLSFCSTGSIMTLPICIIVLERVKRKLIVILLLGKREMTAS